MATLPRLSQLLSTILEVPEAAISDDTCLGKTPEEKMIRYRQLLDALRDTYDLWLDDPEVSPQMTVGQVRKLLRNKGVLNI